MFPCSGHKVSIITLRYSARVRRGAVPYAFLTCNVVKLNANANFKIPQDYILALDFLEEHKEDTFAHKNTFKEQLTGFQKQTISLYKL
jgi:hypothetical protein